MASPTDFIAPILGCVLSGGPGGALGFEFPPVTAPGFPTIALGGMASTFAGIGYALDFIPPDPENLPSLPTIDIFIDSFLGAAIGLPDLPTFSIGGIEIPGVAGGPIMSSGFPSIEIPGFEGTPFDPGSIIGMIELFVTVPFELFLTIVQSIIDLSLEIPGASTIEGLFFDLGIAIGFPGESIAFFAGCMATSIADAISVLG